MRMILCAYLSWKVARGASTMRCRSGWRSSGWKWRLKKTKILRFDRNSKQRFDFLGFEFYRGKGRQSYKVLQRRTSRKKYKTALVNFAAWCKSHCHLPKPVLFAKLNQKPRGYWQYYGIRSNYNSLHDFFHHARRILYKWLNRRSLQYSRRVSGAVGRLHPDKTTHFS